MKTCDIISVTRDMVGNEAIVKAEILEKSGVMEKVLDTIKLKVEGGARMTDEQLSNHVLEIYENG